MTIKTKLTVNIAIILAIVAAVAAASVLGMEFIKGKLSYLTERSTPYQAHANELQRAIQTTAAGLITLGSSKSLDEYKTYRSETEKSLLSVKNTQAELETLTGEKIETYDELNNISTELFGTTEERLKAGQNAAAAHTLFRRKLHEVAGKLRGLDAKIKDLQTGRSTAFSGALENTKGVSAKFRNIELFKSTLKDFHLAVSDIAKAATRRGVTVGRGKATSAMSIIAQNPEAKRFSPELKFLNDKLEDLVKARTALLAQTGELKTFEEADRDIAEKIEAVSLSIDQEIISSQERYNVETRKQSDIFIQSNIAVDILSLNAELLTAGVSIEGLLENFFRLTDPGAADAQEAELRKVLDRIGSIEKGLEKALTRIEATEELKVFHASAATLDSVKGLLFSPKGIISTVRSQMTMEERAKRANGRLREIVSGQAEKGRKSVTVAQGEQEKAIGAVNNTVRSTILLIAIISMAAVVSGTVSGIWVYRSISRPLNSAGDLLQKVSQGDLTVNIEAGGEDEIGRMLLALREMIRNLKNIISQNKEALNEVSAAAYEISEASHNFSQRITEQAASIEETSATMEQMSASIKQTADNAKEANRLAQMTREVAETGTLVMNDTISAMSDINKSSGKIANISNVIEEIAFQTNLLALNAAVEAARAGEHGKGFAVVASEIRNLAQRASQSAKEITGLIEDSVEKTGRGARLANELNGKLGEVGNSIKKVADLMDEVSAAAQEQSLGINHVNIAMTQIDQTTQQNASLVEETSASAEELAAETKELKDLVAFFKTDGTSSSEVPMRDLTARKSAAPRRTHETNKRPLQKTAGQKTAAVAKESKTNGGFEEF